MRLLLVLILLAGVGAAGWAFMAWTAPGPAARSGSETVVLIPPRTRTHDVAQLLADKGVVANAMLFEADAHLTGQAGKLKAGEYAIPSGASMASVAGILVEGRSIQHKLTAAEGLTSEMIWKLVKADPVLEGDAGPMPAEGTLLPETYLFTRGESRGHMIDRMKAAQEKFLGEKWASRLDGLPFKTPREAMILASIVEKETAIPAERRHVAAVFINRLRIGMKLQTDPTIIYDLTRGYPLGRGIRQSELEAATPHNTYVIAGLPPSPICNPGKEAIAAVLNPEKSEDLYFVATGQGGHVFASSLADQARNVAAYRAFERAQQPESRMVQDTGRVGETIVALPDAAAPTIKPVKPAKRARRR